MRLPGGAWFHDPGPDGEVELVVRPEDVRLGPAVREGDVRLAGTVEDAVYLGSFMKYRVRLPDGPVLTAHSPDRDLARLPAPAAGRARLGAGAPPFRHGQPPRPGHDD